MSRFPFNAAEVRQRISVDARSVWWDRGVAAGLWLVGTWFTYRHSFQGFVLFDHSSIIDRSYRIALGQVPYRDYFALTMPLTYFIQAGLLRLFGYHIVVFKASCAVVSGLFGVLTFRVCRRWLGVGLAGLAGVLACVWAPSAILRFPWYHTDAYLFGLIGTLCFLRAVYRPDGNRNWLILAGICNACSLLAVQNTGGAVLAFGFISAGLAAKSRQERLAFLARYTAGATIVGLLWLGYLGVTESADDFLLWTFIRSGQNKGSMVTMLYKVVVIPLVVPPIRETLMSTFFGVTFWSLLYVYGIIAVWMVWGYARTRTHEAKIHSILAFQAFALSYACLTSQQAANLVEAQGFLGVLIGLALGAAHATFPQRRWSPVFVGLLVYTLALGYTGRQAVIGQWMYPYAYFKWGAHTYPVQAERLRGLSMDQTFGPALDDLVRFVNQRIPPDEAFWVVGEPEVIYFATGRRPPHPITNFSALSEVQLDDQARIVADLKRHDVQWVIIPQQAQLTDLLPAKQLAMLPALHRFVTDHFVQQPEQPLKNHLILRRTLITME